MYLRNLLRIRLLLWALGFLNFPAFALNAASQQLGPLEQSLRSAGYQLYNPPRSNWGPGFVFAGDVEAGRITHVNELCPHLYTGLDAPQSANVMLPDYKAEDGFSFKLSFDFLKGLFGAPSGLAQIEGNRSVDIRWQNIHESSYAAVDEWLNSGEPRPIDKRCRLAIDDLRTKNQFKDRVFVIVRAVAPESLIYDFSRAMKVDAAATAALLDEIKAEAKGNAELRNNTQLIIKQPLFVGYAPPMKIQDWLPTGLVSGEIVKVQGVSTNLNVE